MNKKEKLERVFQEKLKDLEVDPPLDSWDFIKDHLEKEDKKRILPIFWWKTAAMISGVAAILIIGIFMFQDKNDTNFSQEKTILDNIQKEKNNSILPSSSNSERNPDNQSSQSQNINSETSKKRNSAANENLADNDTTSEKHQNQKNKNIYKTNRKSDISYTEVDSGENNIDNNSNQTKNTVNKKITSNKSKNRRNSIAKSHSNLLHAGNDSKIRDSKDSSNKIDKKNKADKNLSINRFNQKNKNPSNINDDSEILLADKNIDVSTNQIIPESDTKNNLKDEILNNDSVLLAENILEQKLLKKQDSLNKKTTRSGKISFSGVVAPIFASATQGSAIDPAFDNNNKNFSNNTSYGIKVAYNLSERVKINTGIQYLDLQYNTEDIFFYKQNSMASSPVKKIQTINYSSNSNIYSIENNYTPSTTSTSGEKVSSGNMLQKVSYYEIPLEINYYFLNTKLKISSIIGISGYFLNKNKIFLVSENESIEIGKYNNFNNFHYSGNIGLGFEYPVVKKINLRLEPIFKYNFNAFKNKNNSFDPYFLGIYTGLNYSF